MARVLAIAAHPDDIELSMAGTMLRLARAGFELHYLNIANGSCGTAEHDAETIIRIRREEARAAAMELGATFHESLTNDLEIFYEPKLLRQVGSVVRAVAPEILLAHSPEDYMEDHTNACRLAVTAAFSRGMSNFVVDPPCPPIGQDVTVYHAQPHGNCDGLGHPIAPDLLVDVTSEMERKTRALACHQSQKRWLDESQGMDSYLAFMRDACRELGRRSGRFEFAEGWRRHHHLGFCSPEADPLAKVLSAP